MSFVFAASPHKSGTLAHRMAVLIAAVVGVVTVLGSGISAWIAVRHLDHMVELEVEDAFRSVQHNLEVFDRILLSIEEKWESEFRERLPALAARLVEDGRDLGGYSPAELRKLADEYGFSELYFIDRSLIVRATSFTPDQGLDMTQFTPEYTAYLRGLIGAGEIGVDRVATSTKTGALKKYAYYSPVGMDWIINADVTVQQRLDDAEPGALETFLYTDFIDGILASGQMIRDVDLLILTQVDRWSLLREGQRIDEEIGDRLFAGGSVWSEVDRQLTIYRPVELSSYHNPGTQMAASVTLDISHERDLRTVYIVVVVASAAVALAIGILMAVFVLRRVVTSRVDDIVAGLVRAATDRNTRLPEKGNDELAVIASSINRMIQRISEQESQLENANRHLETTIEHRTAELKAAMTEAERANKARTNFFATITHELRTPLNAIIGFAQLLNRLPCDQLTEERVRSSTETIEMAGQHLLSLINNILDMSKIEAGRYELDIADIDVGRALQATGEMLRPLLEHGDIALETKIDGDPLVARVDERSLRQIVMNLVSNAIKFSERGSLVTVAARCDDKNFVLTVRDQGAGMTEEGLKTALEPFGQIQSESVLVRQEGSGLGLPTVKALAELHGGTMTLDSRPSQGTTVTITLPQKAAVTPY